ncbi:hypothetical protein JXQ31_19740 [candidate division KSB1 bacterium]|nr:hypothetical protein [candidate division KSB1 bacterium]
MKKYISLFVMLSLVVACSTNKDPLKTQLNENGRVIDDTLNVYKPNIYLYPETAQRVTVRLDVPRGGAIVESDPEYDNGWNVWVEPSGLIDRKYSYLFYECRLPMTQKLSAGWKIPQSRLKSFFTQNLRDNGFNDREIRDFIQYWMPLLNDFPYYTIYPLYTRRVDVLLPLHISPSPDNLLRLWYVVEGADRNAEQPSTPAGIPQFVRRGFCAAEWGVIYIK